MAIKLSWTLTRTRTTTKKTQLINHFAKVGMTKSGISEAHSVRRTTLNMILSAKKIIFNSYKIGCMGKRMCT